MDDELPDDDGPALPKRRLQADTEMDMTPMIDCTFLLLVFFVVGAKLDPDAVVIIEVFSKKTSVTPPVVLDTCRRRLRAYDATAHGTED